jgi:peptidoglycan/xylan/chitin deacetylase (PgdA/CDA1 family)
VGAPRRIAAVLAAAVVAAGCGGAPAHHEAPKARGSPPAAVDAGTAPVHRSRVPSGPRHVGVPILMYHVVAAAPSGTPYPQLWVSPALFERQIRALARAGYHATTLDTVWHAWHGRGAMPRRPIVLSFDDGYASQSTNARRMLDRLSWPGVLNLEVNNVRLPGGIRRGQVRAMMRDGWEIDAHTLTHPDLTTVDAARLRQEVAGSRSWLRHAFGAPVDFFCYPAGRYNATVEAAVRAAGYDGATTTTLGEASRAGDPDALPRVRVTPQMTAADLVAVVRRLHPA